MSLSYEITLYWSTVKALWSHAHKEQLLSETSLGSAGCARWLTAALLYRNVCERLIASNFYRFLWLRSELSLRIGTSKKSFKTFWNCLINQNQGKKKQNNFVYGWILDPGHKFRRYWRSHNKTHTCTDILLQTRCFRLFQGGGAKLC